MSRKYFDVFIFLVLGNLGIAANAAASVTLAEVRERTYLQIAGLQTGDRIDRYEQIANEKLLSGNIDDPLTLTTLQALEMARAPITLIGRRGTTSMRWQIHAQPDRQFFFAVELPIPPKQRARFATNLVAIASDTPATDAAVELDAAIDKARQSLGHRWAAWLAMLASGHAKPAQLSEHFRDLALNEAKAAGAIGYATTVHMDRAKAEGSRGHWPIAFAEGQAALDELTTAGDMQSLAAAEASYMLGAMYARASKAGLAFPELARAETLYASLAPDYWQRAVNAIEQGSLAYHVHDREAAGAYYERALAVFRAGDPNNRWVLSALTSLAIVEDHRGNLARSHALLTEAEPLLATMPDDQLKPSVLRNFAQIEVGRGDFASAERHLHEAVDVGTRFPRRDGLPLNAVCDISELLEVRGDFDEALRDRQRCTEQHRAYAPHSAETALSLLAQADIELDLGQVEAATAHTREALEMQRELNDGKSYSPWPLLSLADTEIGREHYAQARELVESARLIITQTHAENSSEDGAVSMTDGELRLAMHDYTGAHASLQRALALKTRHAPDTVGEARAHHALGEALLGEGKRDEARAEFCAAAAALERQIVRLGGGGEARAHFLSKTRRIPLDCADAQIQAGELPAAFLTSERGRARGLLQLINERSLEFADDRQTGLRSKRNIVDTSYDEAAAQLGELGDAQATREPREKLVAHMTELRDERLDLTRRLRETAPHLAALTDPQPLDAGAAAAALDPGSVLVDYLIGDKRSWMFVLPAGDASKLQAYPIALGVHGVREQVDHLRALIAAHDPTQIDELNQLASALYRQLLRPAESELARAQRIIIAADGPLALLPFAALRHGTGVGASYLIAWKPLTQIASITVFAETKATRTSRSNAQARIEAFGDPHYAIANTALLADTRTRHVDPHSITALPATRQEVDTLAALFANSKTYFGDEATETAVKLAAPHASILHLATHGYFDARVPLDSGLLLATPAVMRPGEDNGFLQTWEIFESVRTSADLVTLSACDTALGEESAGEGLLGLTRAFEFAGAHSVLASLWNVSDDSTAQLMQNFYQALAAGATKDQALRAAQLSLIAPKQGTSDQTATRGLRIVETRPQSDANLSHPYYWAGFQLYGDWR